MRTTSKAWPFLKCCPLGHQIFPEPLLKLHGLPPTDSTISLDMFHGNIWSVKGSSKCLKCIPSTTGPAPPKPHEIATEIGLI